MNSIFKGGALSINKRRWMLLIVATLLVVAGTLCLYNQDSNSRQLEILQAVASRMQPQVIDFFAAHEEDFSRLDQLSKTGEVGDIKVERIIVSNGFEFKYYESFGGPWLLIEDTRLPNSCLVEFKNFLELPDCPFVMVKKKGEVLTLQIEDGYDNRCLGWKISMAVHNSQESIYHYNLDLDKVWSLGWTIYAPT